jgi:nitrite reductase (NADH) small subunit/3-phenylpropionate/trans-cinnamate dioxygenase ferredoxin subunit
VAVAKTADLAPGRGRVVRAGETVLALFNMDGRFYALDNVCPHRMGPLGEGPLEGDCAVCPWHGWKFSVETGISPVNPAVRVKTYPVTVEGDEVKVMV